MFPKTNQRLVGKELNWNVVWHEMLFMPEF